MKASFTRTFLETNLPAWVLLLALIAISRGNLVGAWGLLWILALVFPGIWAALRLS